MCSRAGTSATTLNIINQNLTSSIHPSLSKLRFLNGCFVGRGRGHYPQIQSFEYFEKVNFIASKAKPIISYLQQSFVVEGSTIHFDKPLHSESGFFRVLPSNLIEFTCCDPVGLTQVYNVIIEQEEDNTATKLVLTSTGVLGTASAKSVQQVVRKINLLFSGKNFSYELDMSAMGQNLQNHLIAQLIRLPNDCDVNSIGYSVIKPSQFSSFSQYFGAIVDVREDYEFASGSIPTAIHLPLGQITSSNISQNLIDSWQGKPILFVCAGGIRSETACKALSNKGFLPINYEGGMRSYLQSQK
eukprot:TRINITY_DN136_c1_g1_i1.p1 TRINITY_DN136_c1_g1~~TRINITY_DN136_c1_g1_i1.p1  ORF type:complete len:300 (+),score=141.13 TRINITY_DN136_c1_g1_i1:92-991(+)